MELEELINNIPWAPPGLNMLVHYFGTHVKGNSTEHNSFQHHSFLTWGHFIVFWIFVCILKCSVFIPLFFFFLYARIWSITKLAKNHIYVPILWLYVDCVYYLVVKWWLNCYLLINFPSAFIVVLQPLSKTSIKKRIFICVSPVL